MRVAFQSEFERFVLTPSFSAINQVGSKFRMFPQLNANEDDIPPKRTTTQTRFELRTERVAPTRMDQHHTDNGLRR